VNNLHIFAQIYRPANEQHLQQMVDCIEHNADLPFVRAITLLDEGSGATWRSGKIQTISAAKRASYADLMRAVTMHDSWDASHFALMNSDIFLSEDISDLMQRVAKPSTVAAITRRELNGQLRPRPQSSQDVWLFRAHRPSAELVNSCYFHLGVAGCENLFAMSLYAHGYEVWNPCANCTVTHNDPSPRMNFPEWVFGAYLWLPPCTMEDVETKQPSYLLTVLRKNSPAQPVRALGGKSRLLAALERFRFMSLHIRRR